MFIVFIVFCVYCVLCFWHFDLLITKIEKQNSNTKRIRKTLLSATMEYPKPNAFIAPLSPSILEQMNRQYKTDNVIQLNNMLLGPLLQTSRELGCPVWMNYAGIVTECVDDDEFNELKNIYGELSKMRL